MLVLSKNRPFCSKINQIASKINQLCPDINLLSVSTVYLLNPTSTLSSSYQHKLANFLESQEIKLTEPSNSHHLKLWVTPRIGTISPWSSKATDILHNCGFKDISRIEKLDFYEFKFKNNIDQKIFIESISLLIHDKMTQSIIFDINDAKCLFNGHKPREMKTISILENGISSLKEVNSDLGLALSKQEIDYLYQEYSKLKRNPTDVELMMFGQINSEHCRHKIFNASWRINGIEQKYSLFQMIKHTYKNYSENILSAYSDNSSVINGFNIDKIQVNPKTNEYQFIQQNNAILMKVETHNHPTAIAPYEGAATGQGGEIRDEGATGRGGKPKAGLCGFSVSNLCIPGYTHEFEGQSLKGPNRISTPLDIMLKAPIGGAAFNNEFGRPNICGYFRTYEQHIAPNNSNTITKGYHKPIMIAGGLGNIDQANVEKQNLEPDCLLIVLGGPAMEIGLGGGAASSLNSGVSCENLDYASVQRDNPEMQRRVQEVINSCIALGADNPIISIHDIGAGGLCNGLPELVHDSGLGAKIELRNVPNAELGMSPLAIWCCEAQERYVLGINQVARPILEQIAERERCPIAILGKATADNKFSLNDKHFSNKPVDLPMDVLFGNPPKIIKDINHENYSFSDLNFDDYTLDNFLEGVLQVPSVADKSFLITIGDRTVGGLTVRDQMVGPWQVPVADCGVTKSGFKSVQGEAMAMGERAPIAIINAAASARMAVGEAITNIASARIKALSDIKLSGNWMAACGNDVDDYNLYSAVKAVGLGICPDLDITIPVGKDSLSMRTVWQDPKTKQQHEVSSPVSLVISAFAPVIDVRKSLTPELNTDLNTDILLIDLANGAKRLGGSALAYYTNQLGNLAPDVDNPSILNSFFEIIQNLNQQDKILAYHDRSDGGLWAALCEMAFAANCGLDINLDNISKDNQSVNEILFNEELGALIQVDSADRPQIIELFAHVNINIYSVASINQSSSINIINNQEIIYTNTKSNLHALWSKTSYHMQSLRDNPECASEAYTDLTNNNLPKLSPSLSFDLNYSKKQYQDKPKVAILREQGVNGHIEMAAAFDAAGFTPIDVHMSDLIEKRHNLSSFVGLVACGGFSYGDVLGAGTGWACTILNNSYLLDQFSQFFNNPKTFSLGVCNGCQMLSQLKSIIPGAAHWPEFKSNKSEQFESRLSMVTVSDSPSILLKSMVGSKLPIVVAHGEGRVQFKNSDDINGTKLNSLVSLSYTDNSGEKTERYPFNPNGSLEGITALTTVDGRVTIMMPHPERLFQAEQFSWCPKEWGSNSPWQKLFDNARDWVG